MPRRARDKVHRPNIISASTAGVTTVGLIYCSSANAVVLGGGRNEFLFSFSQSSLGFFISPLALNRLDSREKYPLTKMSSLANSIVDDRRSRSDDDGGEGDGSSSVPEFPRSPKMRMKVFRRGLIKAVREKDVDSALSLYSEATRLGCQPTEGMFNTILNLCGDSGKVRH